MVKFFTKDHVYEHDFNTVTSAWWRKYPNVFSIHMKEVDIAERKLDNDGNLVTSRLLMCEQQIPTWMKALVAQPQALAAETVIVSPSQRKMVISSQNLTGSSMMVVEETCTYEQHSLNPNWTHYKQEAKIAAFVPFMQKKLEAYSFENISSKSKQGVEAIEKLCQRIKEEGVLSLLKNPLSS